MLTTVLAALAFATADPPGPAAPEPALLTVAERSGFTATARHEEVLALIDAIASRSTRLRRAELGRSFEGRELPLVILAEPPLDSAAAARASGKAIVFAFGNIHAGEVCGKEGLMMLARELALDPDPPLLRDLVVVLAPIYNADGNERVSPDNRPGQVGPSQGMGQRANAQGLDLNRDYVKLEAPETRAMARFLSEWDPHLVIDTHTTNGSRHRYELTYAAPLNPSGDAASIGFVRDTLLPEVGRQLESRTGYATFFYGNLDRRQGTWATYSAQPRFGGPYHGLRGQMSVLSEAYAYASYEVRVKATLEFVREILSFAAAHRSEILDLHERARRETIAAGANPQPDDVVGIRHKIAAHDEPAVIRGFRGDTDEPADLTVVHLGRFEPTRSVRRPHAYLLAPAPGQQAVVENLRNHGVEVRPFDGAATVEAYTIRSVERAARAFEGHQIVSIEADASIERRGFDQGTLLVPVAQPLGTLAVYLLEPESEDGLAAWNFFDAEIEPGATFPVFRVRSAGDLE